MNNEKQNILIAEFLGVHYHKPTKKEIKSGSYYQHEPKYTDDINLIQYAVKQLKTYEQKNKYWVILHRIVCPYDHPSTGHWRDLEAVGNATAKERCKALLITIGKWTEDNENTCYYCGEKLDECWCEEKL